MDKKVDISVILEKIEEEILDIIRIIESNKKKIECLKKFKKKLLNSPAISEDDLIECAGSNFYHYYFLLFLLKTYF